MYLQVWRRLTAIQMRANPGLVRLGFSLGWPRHQMVERTAALQKQEAKDSITQVSEEEEEWPIQWEKRVRQEVEEDLVSLPDEGEDKQRGEGGGSNSGDVWRKMLYMITNHPGPNSIHSPVKVCYPDHPFHKIQFPSPGDHRGSLLSITPAWRMLFHWHA